MIRRMLPGEEQALSFLWLRSACCGHPFIPASYWENNRLSIEREYLPGSETMVFEAEGIPLAFLSVAGDGWIGGLFVEPAARRQGIGAALLRRAKQAGRPLSLAVYSQNKPACAFYQKQGFTPVKERLNPETKCMEQVMEWKRENLR